MKLASYFSWAASKQQNNILYGDSNIISDAISYKEFITLSHVYQDKKKFQSLIAYYLASLADDKEILSFIEQLPESTNTILEMLPSQKRFSLAKFIVNELNGWVSNTEVYMFVAKFIKDTEFLRNLLTTKLLKPSIIILHHMLSQEQQRELIQYLTVNQLVSVLADCETNIDVVTQILLTLKNKNALNKIFEVSIDSQENTFLHLASPLLINSILHIVALTDTPPINKNGLNPLEYSLLTGNFARVSFLKKFGFPFHVASKVEFVAEAICYALNYTEDKYKYNAIAHMLKQCRIELPVEFHYIHEFINNPKSCQIENINALKPYFCLLANYYFEHSYPQGKDDLVQIQNTMTAINHDFSLEILSHAGYIPEPLKENTIVYRGAIGPLDEDFIRSFFEVGYHSSFSFKNGNQFNSNAFLNFNTKSSSNNDNITHFEFCGNFTYLSQNPYHSLGTYAASRLKKKPDNVAFLIEARLEKGAPKIVGANSHEFEFIVDFIPPHNIKAIYFLDQQANFVEKLYNPNYKSDHIESNPFFESGKPDVDSEKLMQLKEENEQYYFSTLGKYRRPSKFNNVSLQFDKINLHKFIQFTHENMKDNGFLISEKILSEHQESKLYSTTKKSIFKASLFHNNHCFFADFKEKYEHTYPDRSANGYGPGAIILT